MYKHRPCVANPHSIKQKVHLGAGVISEWQVVQDHLHTFHTGPEEVGVPQLLVLAIITIVADEL